MQLMQPRAMTKIWANDTTTGIQETGGPQREKVGAKPKPKTTNVEVRTVDAPARRVPINKGKTSEKLTQVHVRFEDELDSEDDDFEVEAGVILNEEIKDAGDNVNLTVYAGELANNETVSDMQYLKGRVKENWSEDEDDNEEAGFSEKLEENEDGTDISIEQQSEEAPSGIEISPELVVDQMETASLDLRGQNGGEQVMAKIDAEQQEDVSDSGRLFVRNLPYTAR